MIVIEMHVRVILIFESVVFAVGVEKVPFLAVRW